MYNSQLQKNYFILIQKMCGDRVDAFQWLCEFFNFIFIYDHVIDEDPIDKVAADRAFEDVLVKWPANKFWRDNQLLLVPVISSSIDAWKFGNLKKSNYGQMMIYTEVVSAVALLLGGVELRDKYSTAQRELAVLVAEENNKPKQEN